MENSEILPEPLLVTLKVTSILEEQQIPYFIGGSIASSIFGIVRTTQDSDIIADMQPHHKVPFVQEIQEEFYIDKQMVTRAISEHSSFNIIHRGSMFKVDIFIPHMSRFVQSQFKHIQKISVSTQVEAKANFAAVEDIILAKLGWYRMGGEVSERQWRDIVGLLKVQSNRLRYKYLYIWAEELKVIRLLQRAIYESKIG